MHAEGLVIASLLPILSLFSPGGGGLGQVSFRILLTQ